MILKICCFQKTKSHRVQIKQRNNSELKNAAFTLNRYTKHVPLKSLLFANRFVVVAVVVSCCCCCYYLPSCFCLVHCQAMRDTF